MTWKCLAATAAIRILILSAACRAAMPFRSEPAEAAVAEVLGTLSVRVAETLTLPMSIRNVDATTWATLVNSPCPISVPPWFRWTLPSV